VPACERHNSASFATATAKSASRVNRGSVRAETASPPTRANDTWACVRSPWIWRSAASSDVTTIWSSRRQDDQDSRPSGPPGDPATTAGEAGRFRHQGFRMSPPEILTHQIDPGLEQVERRSEGVGHRRTRAWHVRTVRVSGPARQGFKRFDAAVQPAAATTQSCCNWPAIRDATPCGCIPVTWRRFIPST
jgi:hypothetical protein